MVYGNQYGTTGHYDHLRIVRTGGFWSDAWQRARDAFGDLGADIFGPSVEELRQPVPTAPRTTPAVPAPTMPGGGQTVTLPAAPMPTEGSGGVPGWVWGVGAVAALWWLLR